MFGKTKFVGTVSAKPIRPFPYPHVQRQVAIFDLYNVVELNKWLLKHESARFLGMVNVKSGNSAIAYEYYVEE
ncbi:hypothetical protein H9L19_06760 [Weissella diestrammenae]|uniref:Uncharacterized protein n=1 Tax=Weissella diestrammenae TaxID=1162633 RepID=A0A7G9T4P7_9LACO|nr:hypothetical protein [Weissella diestrammenae]MCM0582779.1 hypothetical protein [Weissella diestrammenae]QNN75072.1 hypothetical protein H9L19_06760 [Weissella diestrammenae]